MYFIPSILMDIVYYAQILIFKLSSYLLTKIIKYFYFKIFIETNPTLYFLGDINIYLYIQDGGSII